MRRNILNETFCHSADEVRNFIDEHQPEWDVYALPIQFDRTEPPARRAFCAIHTNQDGDTVCFIEAAKIAVVKEILDSAGVQRL